MCARVAEPVSAPGTVAELDSSVVVADEAVAVRGYCCLVLRRHVVELHQLTELEGAAFMADVRRVAAAVQQLTGAIKINYEIQGNIVPHVHMHLVPRYADDAIERTGSPFNMLAGTVYETGEFDDFVANLAGALQR